MSKPTDSDAAAASVDSFMQGIKLIDLPEGKRVLQEVQWITGYADFGPNFYSRPVYTEATTLFEGLFDTDIEGIKGYKRLMELQAVSQAKTPLVVRFLVIAFKDKATAKWRILASGTDESVDVDENLRYFAAHLHDTRSSSAQENYLSYGHWLLKAGRINDAREALRTALKSKVTADGPDYVNVGKSRYLELHKTQIEALLEVVARVSGEPEPALETAADSKASTASGIIGQVLYSPTPGYAEPILYGKAFLIPGAGADVKAAASEVARVLGDARRQAASDPYALSQVERQCRAGFTKFVKSLGSIPPQEIPAEDSGRFSIKPPARGEYLLVVLGRTEDRHVGMWTVSLQVVDETERLVIRPEPIFACSDPIPEVDFFPGPEKP